MKYIILFFVTLKAHSFPNVGSYYECTNGFDTIKLVFHPNYLLERTYNGVTKIGRYDRVSSRTIHVYYTDHILETLKDVKMQRGMVKSFALNSTLVPNFFDCTYKHGCQDSLF